MLKTDRQKSILLLFLIILAVLAAAPSLTALQLQPGQPLPSGAEEAASIEPVNNPSVFEPTAYTLIQGLLALLFVLITIFLFFNLILHLDWKRSINAILILVGLAALIIILPRPALTSSPAASYLEDIPTVINPDTTQSPLGAPPQTLIWVVLVGLAAVAVLGFIWWISRKRHPHPAVDPIGAQAFMALHALESGEDLNNVLIRCYRQMSLTLQEEQSIERSETMTATEFEGYLMERGLPEEPIHQLTLLFEKARYSNLALDEQDAEVGWRCLSAVSDHCRKEGKHAA